LRRYWLNEVPACPPAAPFIAALLSDQTESARELVRPSLHVLEELRSACFDILEPAAREIRRLSRRGDITAPRAHFLTVVIQALIEEASATVFAVPPKRAPIMVAPESPNDAEVTARVIADALQMDGFETTFVSPFRGLDGIDGKSPWKAAALVAILDQPEPAGEIAITLFRSEDKQPAMTQVFPTARDAVAAIARAQLED
jgi:hypothetical protein